MTPALLLEHFDRLSEAPDAVARLRQFVLGLAVRGRLVAQVETDVPAWDSSADKEQGYFEVPGSWRWARLGSLGSLRGGGTPSKGNSEYWDGPIPWVSPKDMKRDYIEAAQLSISEKALRESAVNLIDPGSVLFVVRGMILAHSFPVAIARVPVTINQDMKALTLSASEMSEYVLRALKGLKPQILLKVQRSSHGTCRIEADDYAGFMVPIPPLAEQHRIVAKVDELMALCDQLEAAQKEREARRDRLTVASLHRLREPAQSAEAEECAGFCIQRLPRFLARPDHVAGFRDCIVDLALTGRIVAHSVDGESGETLLDRMARSRGRGKRPIELLPSSDSLPCIPDGWVWCTIDQIAADEEGAITDGPFGANLKTADYVTTVGYRVVRLQNIGRGVFREQHYAYIDEDRFRRLEKHRVRPGDLIIAGLVDPLMRCCEAPADIGPAIVKADCYRLRVHPDVSARFAAYYLNSSICQSFAVAHHHGMTLVRIGLGNFRQIPFPLPPREVQEAIVAKLDQISLGLTELEDALMSAQDTCGLLLDASLTG